MLSAISARRCHDTEGFFSFGKGDSGADHHFGNDIVGGIVGLDGGGLTMSKSCL